MRSDDLSNGCENSTGSQPVSGFYQSSLKAITSALSAGQPVILAADDDESVREPVKLFCSLVAKDYSTEFGSSIPFLITDRPEAVLAVLGLLSRSLLSKVIVVTDNNYGSTSNLSGTELIQKIESHHPGVRNIVFSGDIDLPAVKDIQARGAATVIGKPNFTELISTLRAFVGIPSRVMVPA